MPEQHAGIDVTRVWTSTELADTSGNKNIPVLGQRFTDGRTGKQYKFMRATTAWNANDAITLDTAGANEPNDGAPCSAVSQILAGIAVSTVAINGAGWVQISGEYSGADGLGANVATASTANSPLGTTATSGRLTSITFAGPSNAEGIAALAYAAGVRAWALDAGSSNRAQVVLYGG